MNDVNTEEDFKLIKAYQKSDRKAINQLIIKYYEYIYKVFRQYRDIPDDESQDFTQDVCLRLIKSLKEFKFESSFKCYLDQIIKHKFIDYLRTKQKMNLYFIPIAIFEDDDNETSIIDNIRASRDLEPDQDLMEQDLIRIIKYCLSLIKNKRMQQIVNLWLHQLKQKQIASLLDVTKGYVGGTLNRGKKIFRKCIMENYPI